MNKFYGFFAFVVLCCFATTNLCGQTPKISIQGTLKDANGAAISDGTINVIFKLYNMESTGTVLWTEEAPVNVTGGIYSHYLGSVTPLTVPMFANTLWMEVKVGGYTLTPRTELTYAPYSLAVKEVVCSGALGDVKYSVMNPTQFAAVNGDCWIPMDGRAIAGSRLNTTLGWSNVPDAGGLFFRSQEFAGSSNYDTERSSGSTIAQIQGQSYQSHSHGINDPGHTHNLWKDDNIGADGNINPDYRDGNVFNGTTGSSTTGITIQNSGGSETRPYNMNLWAYIRIN